MMDKMELFWSIQRQGINRGEGGGKSILGGGDNDCVINGDILSNRKWEEVE